MTIKAGTHIEMLNALGVSPEMAVIARWRTATNGERGKFGDGWHIVRFQDGGKLCVHESSFRVIDNR